MTLGETAAAVDSCADTVGSEVTGSADARVVSALAAAALAAALGATVGASGTLVAGVASSDGAGSLASGFLGSSPWIKDKDMRAGDEFFCSVDGVSLSATAGAAEAAVDVVSDWAAGTSPVSVVTGAGAGVSVVLVVAAAASDVAGWVSVVASEADPSVVVGTAAGIGVGTSVGLSADEAVSTGSEACDSEFMAIVVLHFLCCVGMIFLRYHALWNFRQRL